VREGGGFYVATEGNPERKLKDMLLRVAADGTVEEEITLPEAMTAQAARFGFEGVAVTGSGADETIWLAVQREWKDDPKGLVKILTYKPASKSWGVLHYPLSPAASGAWIGLSELVAVGGDRFLVIERDNLFGAASFKTIQSFSVAGLTPAPLDATSIPVVSKTELRNLRADLSAGGGYVLDKVEGLTLDAARRLYVVTDNDGVDGSNGETRLLDLGAIVPR
jgi:Esterase-like activity of phytase